MLAAAMLPFGSQHNVRHGSRIASAKRLAPSAAARLIRGPVRRVPLRQRASVSAARSRSLVAAVEANLLSRLFRIFRAFVSNILESFEDPERMLDRVTDEMREDLIRMKQASARVWGSERQLATKQSQAQATADEWLRRAELAVRRSEDDLAREALKRRKTFQTTADALNTQVVPLRNAREQLNANIAALEAKLQEAQGKRETLKARAASAKSAKALKEMIGGMGADTSTAFAAFEKMESKVQQMEAEAEVAGQLATPENLEARFAALEGGGVEGELEVLKRGQQLPGPPPVESQRLLRDAVDWNRSAVDDDIDAIRRRQRQANRPPQRDRWTP